MSPFFWRGRRGGGNGRRGLSSFLTEKYIKRNAFSLLIRLFFFCVSLSKPSNTNTANPFPTLCRWDHTHKHLIL